MSALSGHLISHNGALVRTASGHLIRQSTVTAVTFNILSSFNMTLLQLSPNFYPNAFPDAYDQTWLQDQLLGGLPAWGTQDYGMSTYMQWDMVTATNSTKSRAQGQVASRRKDISAYSGMTLSSFKFRCTTRTAFDGTAKFYVALTMQDSATPSATWAWIQGAVRAEVTATGDATITLNLPISKTYLFMTVYVDGLEIPSLTTPPSTRINYALMNLDYCSFKVTS